MIEPPPNPGDQLLSLLLHGDPPSPVVDDLGCLTVYQVRSVADLVALHLGHAGIEVTVRTEPLRSLAGLVADLPNGPDDMVLFEATTVGPDDAIQAARDLAARLAEVLT